MILRFGSVFLQVEAPTVRLYGWWPSGLKHGLEKSGKDLQEWHRRELRPVPKKSVNPNPLSETGV